jgi:hypothetical protein
MEPTMKFRIFPQRSIEERTSETRGAIAICASFAAVSLIGLGLFFYGGDVPPVGKSLWSTIRWVALLCGAISLYLTVQGLFELVIVATVGPERFFAIMVGLGLIAALFGWLSY